MNTNEAKQIRIEEYLHSLGYNPVRRQGDSLWYKSPFRDEQEPSFKVNVERNLWYDFGASRGGNIIALAQELYASDSLPYLLERIAEQAPNVRPVSFSFGGQPLSKPSFRQLEVVPLSSPALLSYLRQRGINTELAKRECREVRYLTGGKPYFAVGFPNRSGAALDLPEDGVLSASFLGSVLLDLTGRAGESPWFDFLSSLRRIAPVVQKKTYILADGSVLPQRILNEQTDEASMELKDAVRKWRCWSYYKLKYADVG